ncbi:hypothetical protein CDAR_572511, partial [Caerostris darwini]
CVSSKRRWTLHDIDSQHAFTKFSSAAWIIGENARVIFVMRILLPLHLRWKYVDTKSL